MTSQVATYPLTPPTYPAYPTYRGGETVPRVPLYPQPAAAATGWICPKCGRVMGPMMVTCTVDHSGDHPLRITSTTTVAPPVNQ